MFTHIYVYIIITTSSILILKINKNPNNINNMNKYDYNDMFTKLYAYYTAYGDNDKTWEKIIKEITSSGWLDCQLHSSRLYFSLYAEAKSFIIEAIVYSFRTYRPSSPASVYTWCTRLANQATWRYIRDRMKSDKITNFSDEYTSDYEDVATSATVEDDYIALEDTKLCNIKLYDMLKVTLRNDIYMEIYCYRKGLFSFNKLSSTKDIAEAMNVTERTVEQANVDNKIRIGLLKRYIREGNDVSKLTKETFENFKKSKNK